MTTCQHCGGQIVSTYGELGCLQCGRGLVPPRPPSVDDNPDGRMAAVLPGEHQLSKLIVKGGHQ